MKKIKILVVLVLAIFFISTVAPIVGGYAEVDKNKIEGKEEFDGAKESSYVSGYISTDTTWTLANSPYIITGNVMIDNNATLTIEPGVVIKFNGSYGIAVDGYLKCNGTAANPIIFTSNKTTPAKGDWG
ncbi:MAG: hypothetical protein KKB04_02505, partial [Candidatus Thermoplasmatota archaeon]|nr:hypothetical protein [Candidatus Thermoplasmatota archaeon]